MIRFTTINGLSMIKCKPLNFREDFTYVDNTGPLVYSIGIGTWGEMYNCIYKPEEEKLYISRITYEDNDTLVFYTPSFEIASAICYSFALGKFDKSVLEGTIYLD